MCTVTNVAEAKRSNYLNFHSQKQQRQRLTHQVSDVFVHVIIIKGNVLCIVRPSPTPCCFPAHFFAPSTQFDHVKRAMLSLVLGVGGVLRAICYYNASVSLITT